MPIEYTLLRNAPEPRVQCPKCGAQPFRAFLRGQVQSMWRDWLGLPYCCVICANCKKVVGYERPKKGERDAD